MAVIISSLLRKVITARSFDCMEVCRYLFFFRSIFTPLRKRATGAHAPINRCKGKRKNAENVIKNDDSLMTSPAKTYFYLLINL